MENHKKGDFLEENSTKGDIQVGEVQVRNNKTIPKHALGASGPGADPSAYGKVPHVAAEKGFLRWRFQRLFAGACGKFTEISVFLQKRVSEMNKTQKQISS